MSCRSVSVSAPEKSRCRQFLCGGGETSWYSRDPLAAARIRSGFFVKVKLNSHEEYSLILPCDLYEYSRKIKVQGSAFVADIGPMCEGHRSTHGGSK
jgi:hypothetical protein